jgi:hypothetical protein
VHHFPLSPTLITAQLLNLFVLFGFALHASLTVPGFHLYQPFVGGQAFVVMQAFAYLFATVSLLITATYIHTLETHARHGVLSFAGILSLAGHVLAALSVKYFEELDVNKSTWSSRLFAILRTSPNRETSIVVALQLALCAVCFVACYFPSSASYYLGTAVALHVASGGICHFVIGWKYTAQYRLFMPISSGGFFPCFMQATAWTLFTAGIYAGMFLAAAAGGDCKNNSENNDGELIKSHDDERRMLLFGFAIVCVLSTTCLLIFIRVVFPAATRSFARLSQRGAHNRKTKGKPEGDNTLCVDRSSDNFAAYGARTITIVSTLLLSVVAVIFYIQMEEQQVESGRRNGLSVIETLTTVFLLALPASTHLVGRVAYGDRFELWQPFKGPVDFVLLQSVGWTSFGAAIFCMILHLSGVGRAALAGSASAAFLAQLCVHASLAVFSIKGDHSSDDAGGGDRNSSKIDIKNKKNLANSNNVVSATAVADDGTFDIFLSGVNGEIMTGGALALISFVLRLVCDTNLFLSSRMENSRRELTSTIFFVVSAGFFMCSVPLAHVSVRHKGIAAFSPFEGPGEFIALQAVGWTLFAVLLVSNIHAVTEHVSAALNRSGNSNDQQHQAPTAERWLSLAMQATLNLLPFVIISLSVLVCPGSQRRSLGRGDKSALLQEAGAASDKWDSDRKEEEEEEDEEDQIESQPSPQSLEEAGAIKKLRLYFARSQGIAAAERSAMLTAVGILEQSSVAANRRLRLAVSSGEKNDRKHRVRRRVNAAADAGASNLRSSNPRHRAASLVVILMSLSSGVAFVIAALLEDQQRTLSLVISFGALVVTIASCVGTHLLYGPFMHRDARLEDGSPAYRFFMPFEGGIKFVMLQAAGWGSLAACAALFLVGLLLRDGPVLLVFLSAGVLSVAAQAILVGSVAHFAPSADAGGDREGPLEQTNVEAVVAFLVFLASFLFSHIYTSIAQTAGISSTDKMSIVTVVVPVVITTIATAFALPLSVIAIRRSVKKHSTDFVEVFLSSQTASSENDSFGSISGGDSDARTASGEEKKKMKKQKSPHLTLSQSSVTGSPPRRRRLSTSVAIDVAASAALLALALLPVALMYVGYYATRQYTPGFVAAANSWRLLMLILTITMGVAGVLPHVVHSSFPSSPLLRLLLRFRVCAVTYLLYSLPTIVVVGSYSLPIIFPQSTGAKTFVIIITTLTVGASAAFTRKLCFAANICVIGYVLYSHAFRCFSHFSNSSRSQPFGVVGGVAFSSSFESSLGPPYLLGEVLPDLVTLLFWIPYAKRYHKKPHETGALRSQKFVDFCRRNIFTAVEQYFSMRVICDSDTERNEGAEQASSNAKRKCDDRKQKNSSAAARITSSSVRNPPTTNVVTDKKSNHHRTQQQQDNPDDESRTASLPAMKKEEKNNQKKNCLYSFHPHGIFPGTALFCSLTEAWVTAIAAKRKREEADDEGLLLENDKEGSTTTIHAASVVFNVPLLRDFLLAVGARVVTRRSIESSLQQGNSVLIVTGGQAEMMLSVRSTTEMHLVTHHKGFIKIAVAQKVPLVPILCFSEQNVMDNISVPWLQRRTLKILGFPFPTIPYGRWYLPLPNITPLTIVVGAPVVAPDGLTPDDGPGIDALGEKYFEALRQLFYRHRAAAGYPQMELVLHHGAKHPLR